MSVPHRVSVHLPPKIAPGPASALSLPAIALALLGVAVLLAEAPVAWFFLGASAVLATAVLVPAFATGRFFEPLPFVTAIAAVSFVVRPLFLFVNSRDLISWHPPSSAVDALLRLDNQEVAFFATTNLREDLQPALTRAIGATTIFLALMVAGHALPVSERLARRVSRWSRTVTDVDVRAAIVAALFIGIAGQIAVLLKVGGPAAALDSQLQQSALNAGLALYILVGFSVAAPVMWAACRPPQARRARAAFALVTLEVLLFFALVGSRSRVLTTVLALAIVVHYGSRPLRLRQLALVATLAIVFAAAALGVRQATNDEPFSSALGAAPKYIVDPRGILNDITAFDQLFVVTSVVGHSLDYQKGGWLVTAFHSYVPGFIDHSKPKSPPVEFRKAVFGNKVGAGRPTTIVGDFYYDFGFPGILLGSLLLGAAMRAMLGLVSAPKPAGFTVGLYALGTVVLYQLVVGSYAIALGSVLTLIGPYVVAGRVLPRLNSARARQFLGPPRPRVHS